MFKRIGMASAMVGLLGYAPCLDAGAGRVRVVEGPGGSPVGEIDLTVHIDDPTPEELEAIKRMYRTSSQMMCDITEGYFRYGTIRLVQGTAGRASADVLMTGFSERASPFGIGLIGARALLAKSSGAVVTTHELAHYVLDTSDDYLHDDVTPFFYGEGMPFSEMTPQNGTLMRAGLGSSICMYRDDASQPWRNYDAMSEVTFCDGIEECLSAEQLGGLTAVWGEGDDDTVRCMYEAGVNDEGQLAVAATELLTQLAHDLESGVGAFDQRSNGGSWGDPAAAETLKGQLDAYTEAQLACSDAECVLDHCPLPQGTRELDVELTLTEVTLVADPPAVGDRMTRTEANDLALQGAFHLMQDSVGRWNTGDPDRCPVEVDSKHSISLYLQNVSPEGGPSTWAVWAAVGVSDLAGETDSDLIEVIAVETFTYDELPEDETESLVLISLVDSLQFKDNACFLLVSSDSSGAEPCPGEDPMNPASWCRGETLTPAPASFTVNWTLRRGPASDFVTTETRGEVGDLLWNVADPLSCALLWAPLDDDLQDGLNASARQTVEKGEWEWATIHRHYNTRRNPSTGMDEPFVQYRGLTDLPLAENSQCFIAQKGDSNRPKGPYDVEFVDLTEEGSDQMVVVDRSGSMSTVDGPSGISRIATADGVLRTFGNGAHRDALEFPQPYDQGALIFDHENGCVGITSDPCELIDMASVDEVNGLFGSLLTQMVPRGRTALVDAVRRAADELEAHGTTGREKSIYLLSDGHENASVNPDVDELLESLRSRSISIYGVALGADADIDFLVKATEQTGGVLHYAEAADVLPNAFYLMKSDSQGGAALIPRLDVVSAASNTTTQIERDIEVEEGSEQLHVVLSNGGYEEPAYPGEAVEWDVSVELSNEDGTRTIVKSPFQIDPEVQVVDNSLITIRVPDPPAGTWRMTTSSTTVRSMRSNLTVTSLNPNAALHVGVRPRVTTGEPVYVEPSIVFGGVELDVNLADCSGNVFGPGGFEQALDLGNSELRRHSSLPPFALVSDFNGRGGYRVEVTCEVPADLQPTDYEGERPDVSVTPFSYTAVDHFYLDTDQMPADFSDEDDGDFDNDGFLDDEESKNDVDGDGYVASHDTDSDDDDIDDAIEGLGDVDEDGIVNAEDTESDGDGIPDAIEGATDPDGDGTISSQDTESDGDGIPDAIEGATDRDGDGTISSQDPDSDDDGLDDATEGAVDTDGDGDIDSQDLDSDDDGIPDAEDPEPTIPVCPFSTSGDCTPLRLAALFAEGQLTVGNEVQVLSSPELATIVNSGTTGTSIGVDARTGDILTEASISLSSSAFVDGDVRTNGTITKQSGVNITGAQVTGAGLNIASLGNFDVSIPGGGPPIRLDPDQVASAAPGTYSELTVKSRARLNLRSGVYYTGSVSIEPDATLALDVSAGPIYLFVRNNLYFHGQQTFVGGTQEDVFVGYMGTSPAYLEKALQGTIVAPNALLRLATASLSYVGTYFGKDVQVLPNNVVERVPFAHPWLPDGAEVQTECATLEAETMTHTTGGSTPGGWNIWTNGSIYGSYTSEEPSSEVTVVAKGQAAIGVWPQMTLRLDNVVVGTATVSSPTWAEYSFPVSAPPGTHTLRVSFTNDYHVPPADRNLLVDKLVVSCQ